MRYFWMLIMMAGVSNAFAIGDHSFGARRNFGLEALSTRTLSDDRVQIVVERAMIDFNENPSEQNTHEWLSSFFGVTSLEAVVLYFSESKDCVQRSESEGVFRCSASNVLAYAAHQLENGSWPRIGYTLYIPFAEVELRHITDRSAERDDHSYFASAVLGGENPDEWLAMIKSGLDRH